nr:glycine-rich protein-like [Ipomoea batatas]
MSSKVVVLLGLSLVVFVMIASEVTAREMAETTTTSFNPTKAEKANGLVGDDKHHGGGGWCKHGCCGHGHHGGCSMCCSYKGQTREDAAKP